MTQATHAIIGAAAASLFPEQPGLAFAAGFASHFIIDAIPHWDYDRQWLHSINYSYDKMHTSVRLGKDAWHDVGIVGIDAFIGFLLTCWLAWYLDVPLGIALIGAGAGLFPDFLHFIFFAFRKYEWVDRVLEPLERFHAWVGWREYKYMHPAQGIALQLALVVVVVGLLKIFT
jgi:hypothetical protein